MFFARSGARGGGRGGAWRRILAGQYLGFAGILAVAGAGGTAVYAIVFLALVAVWVAAGRFFATRPAIARLLSRWGHIVLPVVLIGIGLLILLDGLVT
ncbi:hypothetical protein [Actinoplanes sp. RD1]|uniref:hypothetical protein n=1 Tax=Actinoplanes sp. RD1 TaxID=3064538 RepID=UPI0035568614